MTKTKWKTRTMTKTKQKNKDDDENKTKNKDDDENKTKNKDNDKNKTKNKDNDENKMENKDNDENKTKNEDNDDNKYVRLNHFEWCLFTTACIFLHLFHRLHLVQLSKRITQSAPPSFYSSHPIHDSVALHIFFFF